MTFEARPMQHLSSRPVFWAAAALLGTALVFGGGGSPNAWSEMVVQMVAAFLLLGLVWAAPRFGRGHTASAPVRLTGTAIWIGALVLLVPLFQLVPLPPALWQSLPGRAEEVAALKLAGDADSWRAFSVSPHMTLAGLLAMLPPVLLFALTSVLDAKAQRRLFIIIVIAALACALLGTFQVASGGRAFYLYGEVHSPWVTGFFANRNAAADFFLIGSLAATSLLLAPADGARGKVASPRRKNLAATLVIVAVLLVATIFTGSRMGIALILLALILQAALVLPHFGPVRGRAAIVVVTATALAVAAIFLALRGNAEIAAVAARFGATTDFRAELWQDTWFATGRFWPWGAGIGTFVTVFLAGERLEVLDPTMPNRAHNDYLEFMLEAGVAGMVILAAITAILFRAGWRNWKLHPRRRPLLVFAAGTLAIIALHSLVDYPLRNMALSSLAAVAAGLLVGRKTSNAAPVLPGAAEGSD